ncbi:DUF6289 family protein [Pseudomonas sp. CGJS7]|uniref:DUF6289 family protein n=1 Tax=Pseudomonas sp. CGJS7 TaxID=3109348 RepID=UPI0030095E41
MRNIKLMVLGAVLVLSAGAGAATASSGCFCSVVYYDVDGTTVVGISQPAACGDTGWGRATNKSKVYAGCVM